MKCTTTSDGAIATGETMTDETRPKNTGHDDDRDTEREADEQATVRVHLIKADPDQRAIGDPRRVVPAGQSREVDDDDAALWGDYPIVDPPLDPDVLLLLFEVSDTLRSCVDAMVQNIAATGYQPEPRIDLTSEDARDQIATAIHLQALDGDLDRIDSVKPPSEDEVEAQLERYKLRAALERARLRTFVDGVCFEHSFVELRRRTRTDREIIGWGAWEVIRDAARRVVRFKHVPGHLLRLTKADDAVEVKERRPTSAVTYETVPVMRRFRRIVQRRPNGDGVVYFKQYGDPRVMSAKTGKVYVDDEDGNAVDKLKREKGGQPATEILWFANYHPGTPYGLPRWHGVIPGIRGSRLAADNTVDYLDSSAIPRGLLLVSDGRLSSTSVDDLKEFFKSIKGQAQNRMAVVEAMTPRENMLDANSGKVALQWVSLADAQHDDATFGKYVEANAEATGASFRIPSLLRGVTKDFNRATALAAKEYADEQVFAPEREGFDWQFNRVLLDLGIILWRYRSRSTRKTDAETLAKIAEVMLKHGVVTPAEARGIAEASLGIDLFGAAADWQRMPLQLTAAGFTPPPDKPAAHVDTGSGQPAAPPTGDSSQPAGQVADHDSPDDLARKVVALRARLDQALVVEHAARLVSAGVVDEV